MNRVFRRPRLASYRRDSPGPRTGPGPQKGTTVSDDVGMAFRGFTNLADPPPQEIRAWAYSPDTVQLETMPMDWDLLVANDRAIGTIFELAIDQHCPARRFALHVLYIYAADAIRTNFQAHPRRRLKKFVESAEEFGDQHLTTWAHNVRTLQRQAEQGRGDLFDYHDWCEGGLVRNPRRLD
jgi:hypothetical protein